MRLLVTTQVLDTNDPHLGFFHAWVEAFARSCETVTVVCLKEGEHMLPPNVQVFSLGKEHGAARSFVYALRLLRVAIRERNAYDAVFVHMNPEYIAVCGPLWRMTHKKIALWYAHKSKTLLLQIATAFADIVFSVTDQSFPIPTPKLRGMGHGIDARFFVPQKHIPSETLRLLTVGRIAERKHILEMFDVVEALLSRGIQAHLTVAGAPGTPAERAYQDKLLEEIRTRGLAGAVTLAGPVEHEDVPRYIGAADVFLNFSETGNMDKAGLEPLALGVPLVSTNEAFKPMLEPYGLFVQQGNVDSLVEAILRARSLDMTPLREEVRTHHSLEALIPAIVQALT